MVNNMITKLDKIKQEYQSNFTRILFEFIIINSTIQVLLNNMIQHNVDSILA